MNAKLETKRLQKRTGDKRKRITIQSAKAKGRNLQQLAAKKIAEITGCEYGKDLDIDSRPMGQAGTDVILRGKAKELFPFAVETKACESWNVHAWIDQAKANIGDFKTWLLIAKRSRNKPIVIMDYDTFFSVWDQLLNSVHSDRSHEECASCKFEYTKPPECNGHPQGPISCYLFKKRHDQ